MTILYQYSHFLAVSKGCYDGKLSIRALKEYGGIGLGTFNALDGELIALNHKFYHCSQGKVRAARDSEMLPWAAVTSMHAPDRFSVSDISSFDAFQEKFMTHLPSKNYPIAFHIQASVQNIDLGSVPRQDKPYRPIVEVIEDSLLIKTGPLEVDLIGFYAPDFLYPVKASGLHLHCVDKKRRIGGHVLDLHVLRAQISWQQIQTFQLIFPECEAYQNTDLFFEQNMDLPKFEEKLQK